MSCKETTAKINKLLDEAEVLITDVMASKASFLEYAEKKFEEISEGWSSKGVGGWKLETSYPGLETSYSELYIMFEDKAVPYYQYPIAHLDLREAILTKEYKALKEAIAKGMLKCVHNTRPHDLESLRKYLLEPAKLIESSLTEEFFDKIYSMYDSIEQEFLKVKAVWDTINEDMQKYRSEYHRLTKLAGLEWIEEGNLTVGKKICCYPGDTGITIAAITSTELIVQNGRRYSFDDLDVADTWLEQDENKQLQDRADKVLYPLWNLEGYARAASAYYHYL